MNFKGKVDKQVDCSCNRRGECFKGSKNGGGGSILDLEPDLICNTIS